ncbi:MAG: prenyltransferase/squalene oxidase repeat-containing protein [Planctomycetia bacterium]
MSTSGIVWTLVALGGAAAVWGIVRTKWLQTHTLPKCVLLSVVLHAVVAAVCSCLGGLAPASWGRNDTGPMTMLVVAEEEPADDPLPAADAAPVQESSRDFVADTAVAETATIARHEALENPPPDHVPLLDVATAEEPPEAEELADSGEAEQPRDEAEQAAAADATSELPSPALPSAVSAAEAAAVAPTPPAIYADRAAGRRAQAAAARGGSQDTERAVQAALGWLAAAQSSDGSWNAARHGGGVERAVQGHDRRGAGARSDHGGTGLALLAFLGAGNTHLDGSYADTVARGIRFLVARQRPDGSLAGDAEFFAALYCHGMAAIALAECSAMSGDLSLRPPLEKAVRYSLSMQSPATGGWRYAAGDKGDTSQLGWQVMLLASARQAGLAGFDAAEARAGAFLQSVSSGRAGGLAAYRPGERPTFTMTAEALASRLFLGLPADHPTVAEAVELLGRSPPDARSPNAYAWYYATLASFHVGGPQWEAWNQQLQAALLPLQRQNAGLLDGSWDPDPVWGGHGGRVYSTALSALTLEVYYRHLPMHRRTVPVAARPAQPSR